MNGAGPDLPALIGARICHDLASPLGAISNGVELLGMTETAPTPELALIGESAAAATARMRVLRLAFGPAGDGVIGAPDLASLLSAHDAGGRVTRMGDLPDTLPRSEARLLVLSILCADHAIPMGGQAVHRWTNPGWEISVTSDRLRIEERLWHPLSQGRAPQDATPAEVQFALLPGAVTALGRHLSIETGADRLILRL